MLFGFVRDHQAGYPVAMMCRLLQVSLSGFYAWQGRCSRAPSVRERSNAELLTHIQASHSRSGGTYGAPRVQVDLREVGFSVGRKRVARLMRMSGLVGASRRRGVCTTQRSKEAVEAAPDLVKRDFTAAEPNQLWVADITYVPTWSGFLYLAVVLDAYSRRVVGWSMQTTLHTDVVLNALNMALTQRRPETVIHHSDQGSQYTSIAFGQRCEEMSVRPSRGSVGDAYDNAMAESFFATLECELLAKHKFHTQTEARLAIFRFIEGWYNPHRRHSALGYRSPVEYEKAFELDHERIVNQTKTAA